MAMTKAERAQVESLETELRLERAMRVHPRVLPDLPVPGPGEATSGWRYNSHSLSLSRCWSHAYQHGDGAKERVGGIHQRDGVPMFSTAKLALMAMRAELSQKYARELAELDASIAQQEAAEHGHQG